MAFVKLDTRILESTLWIERDCREVFITALLMALPVEFLDAQAQIEVRTLKETGFNVPPGWYGFVDAAGVGIVRRAMVDTDPGLDALEKLGSPDPESRTADFNGRRLVRVNGGYVVLNFMKYRDKDNTGAERARRYRARQREISTAIVTRDPDSVTRDSAQPALVTRDSSLAEVRGQSTEKQDQKIGRATRLAAGWKPSEALEAWARTERPGVDLRLELDRFRDYWDAKAGRDATKRNWDATWRNWIRRAESPGRPAVNGSPVNTAGPSPAKPVTPQSQAEANKAFADYRLELGFDAQ